MRSCEESIAVRAWATRLPPPPAPAPVLGPQLAQLLQHPLLRPVERRGARALPAAQQAAEIARLEALIEARQRNTSPEWRTPLYPS